MRYGRQSRPQRALQVAERAIGGELLLVPIRPQPGQKISILLLNRTAAEIWKVLDGRDVEAISTHLVETFTVDESTALLDTLECLEDLTNAGLVRDGSPP